MDYFNVVLLICFAGLAAAADICLDSNGAIHYCEKCCGISSYHYCCSDALSPASIAGICIGIFGFITIIVTVVICCRRRQHHPIMFQQFRGNMAPGVSVVSSTQNVNNMVSSQSPGYGYAVGPPQGYPSYPPPQGYPHPQQGYNNFPKPPPFAQ